METNIELKPDELLDAQSEKLMKELLNGTIDKRTLSSACAMNSLFINAAMFGKLQVVRCIVENKYCDPNQYALYLAITNGHTDVAHYLIPYHVKNQFVLQGAFGRAIDTGQFEVVQTLLKHMTPDKFLMTGWAQSAFQKKYYDITLLLILTPVVKEYLRDHLKKNINAHKITSKDPQGNDDWIQMTTFKKDCETHLRLINNYLRKHSCHFFNGISNEVLLNDVKSYVINISFKTFTTIEKKWVISQDQLKNIFSIKDSVFVDMDESIPEENTVSPK